MNSVMVLDEDSATHMMLQQILESEGFSVSTAESIAEFHRKNDRSTIDLYIVDTSLADGGGLDLVRHIRSSSSSGIILLCPHDSETCLINGLDLGADDFITKPFRPRELAARVKAVHRRTVKPHAPSLSRGASVGVAIGPYRLYSRNRTVLDAEGREVALTTAEFSIFQVLVSHRGEVLTRDEIIGLSRGRDWQCYERSVDGLISRLRRKLPVREETAHFIKTVHGTGYTIA